MHVINIYRCSLLVLLCSEEACGRSPAPVGTVAILLFGRAGLLFGIGIYIYRIFLGYILFQVGFVIDTEKV